MIILGGTSAAASVGHVTDQLQACLEIQGVAPGKMKKINKSGSKFKVSPNDL